ncbi:MAG: PadR family transcriptional regulator [Methanocalculaceae archaeon]|nr:PadR family transcriptional regulator [Methanocalculaceae archaeon]
MFDRSQLMKGTLEGCILKIIGRETTYGYEIMEKLIHYGFDGIREGTIYPLLVRLEKKNLIASEYRISPLGPSRKYYHLTDGGRKTVEEFSAAWQDISHVVERILTEEE